LRQAGIFVYNAVNIQVIYIVYVMLTLLNVSYPTMSLSLL
jgi:hypothetical protein